MYFTPDTTSCWTNYSRGCPTRWPSGCLRLTTLVDNFEHLRTVANRLEAAVEPASEPDRDETAKREAVHTYESEA